MRVLVQRGLTSLFLLALAVSLDGFGAGLSYGLKRVRLGWRILAVIGLVGGAMAFLSTGAGHLLGRLLGHQWGVTFGQELGAALLLALGLVSLGNAGRGGEEEPDAAEPAGLDSPTGGRATVWSLRLKTWGLVVELARQPGRADLDHSGTISVPEALLLGLALSLDGGSVGLGAGLSGLSPWQVAVAVAPANVALLGLGTALGRRVTAQRRPAALGLLPGIILLLLAVMRLKP